MENEKRLPEDPSQEELEALWQELGQCGIIENDEEEGIDIPFYEFPVGTPRQDIWHWFDDRYNHGVYGLMFPGLIKRK